MPKVLVVGNRHQLLPPGNKFLDRGDFEIEVVLRGDDGLKRAFEFRPALVIMSAILRGMDSVSFVKSLRQDPRTRRASILAIAEPDEEKVLWSLSQAGANRTMEHPVMSHQFDQAVGEILTIPRRKNFRVLIRIQIEGEEAAAFNGTTVNLSLSGLLLETETALSPGQVVLLNCFLPRQKEALHIRGEVVRLVTTRDGHTRYGVQFNDLEEDQVSALNKFLVDWELSHPDADL